MQAHVLPNGLTVFLEPSPAIPVVALQAWIRVGSAQERSREAGISHLLEHMLFKGTRRRGVGELAMEIEAAGGDINAWTEFNNTGYHVVIASRFFDTGLDVLSDAVLRPSFDPVELERERLVVLEEMQQGEDSPHRVNFHQLFGQVFRHHPYGRPVIGRRETVQGITRQDLVAFHRRWYTPGNTTFIIVGDFEPTEALQKVRRAFRIRPRPVPPLRTFSEPAQRAPRVVVKAADVRDAYLLAGFHVPGIRHADTPAIDLAATLLGQGDSSRLHHRVLRQQQLVTDVSAYSYTPHDEGVMTVGASVIPDRILEATAAILTETYRLGFEGVAEEELRKAYVLLESNTLHQRETVQGQARKIGYYAYAVDDPGYEEQYLRLLERVTPTQLRQVMARYLTPRNLSLSLVVPRSTAVELAPGALKRALRPALQETHQALRRRVAARTKAGPGGVVRTELPNGLTLLVKRDASVPLVAMRGVWRGGLRCENPRNNGINHLIASLLTRGTQERTGEEIVGTIESLAGSIGGFTGRNSLGLRLETTSRHWQTSCDVLADCLLHPAFPEAEVARERALALQEIEGRDDNLTGVVFRLFQRALFRRHPYRLSLLGEESSMGALTRERLLRYWRRHYGVGGLTVSVVGDVEEVQAIDTLSRLFERPGRTGRPVQVPAEQARRTPVQVVRHLNRQQAHVLLGFPGVSIRQKSRYALEVLAAILSGQGGRLFLNIRDRQGLVYRISAFSLEGLDPGYFAVYGATSPDKVEQLCGSIREELRRCRTTPVSAVELRRAKRYLIGNHDISLQQRATVASSLAFNDLYGLGYAEYLQYPEAIQAVTARELQRVSRSVLAPGREVVAVVGPEADAAADQEGHPR
ncbi:MAG: pitrilysin family protein [bacterium]